MTISLAFLEIESKAFSQPSQFEFILLMTCTNFDRPRFQIDGTAWRLLLAGDLSGAGRTVGFE